MPRQVGEAFSRSDPEGEERGREDERLRARAPAGRDPARDEDADRDDGEDEGVVLDERRERRPRAGGDPERPPGDPVVVVAALAGPGGQEQQHELAGLDRERGEERGAPERLGPGRGAAVAPGELPDCGEAEPEEGPGRQGGEVRRRRGAAVEETPRTVRRDERRRAARAPGEPVVHREEVGVVRLDAPPRAGLHERDRRLVVVGRAARRRSVGERSEAIADPLDRDDEGERRERERRGDGTPPSGHAYAPIRISSSYAERVRNSGSSSLRIIRSKSCAASS